MADEKEVLRRIDFALRQHPHLRSVAIKTSRTGDSVVLDGSVDTFFEKQMAQEAVRWIEGIPRIDNRLVVRPVIDSVDDSVSHPAAPATVGHPGAY